MGLSDLGIKNKSEKVSIGRRTVLSTLLAGGLSRAISQQGRAQSETRNYTNAWYRPLSGTPTQPVTSDGIIYVGDGGGNVFGYDIRSGETQFEVSVDGQIPKYGLTVTDSAVAVALNSGEIHFFDPDSQELQGRFGLGGGPSGMTNVGSSIYIFDQNGTLSKFDASTPQLTWQEEIRSDNVPNSQTLIAGENRIIIKTGGNTMSLIDPDSGDVLKQIPSASNWQGAFGKWTGTVSNNGNTVCILETFRSNAAYFVNLQSGTVRQFEYTNSGTSTCGPTGGMFFIGGGDQISAIDESTGTVNWQMDFVTTGLSLDVFGEQLIAIGRSGGEGLLRAINPQTSAIEWDVKLTETEGLISNNINQYTFTKPVRIDEYYAVTGSADDDKWIASFGPESNTPTPTPTPTQTPPPTISPGPGTPTPTSPEPDTPTPTPPPKDSPLSLFMYVLGAFSGLGGGYLIGGDYVLPNHEISDNERNGLFIGVLGFTVTMVSLMMAFFGEIRLDIVRTLIIVLILSLILGLGIRIARN